MRATLFAITDELRRLQANGVKTVSISDGALTDLRKLVERSVRLADERNPSVANGGAGLSSETSFNRAGRSAAATTPKVEKVDEPKLPPPPRVALPDSDKPTQWAALAAAVTADEVCQKSIRSGSKAVLGGGSLDASIFFCGEAPGPEEEVQGEPFVGPAGQLLTKMIAAMGLRREDVYLTNVMNWRPQMPIIGGQEQIGSRPPTDEEVNYCLSYLRYQIAIVRPRVIVALGVTAAKALLGGDSFKNLGDVRGQWMSFAGTPLITTYHPNYILRNSSNRSKRAIWEDLLQVMERVELPISEKQRGYFVDR